MVFDIITFLIAILSFFLSIWNFIETRWQNRVSISLDCKDYLFTDFIRMQPLFVGLTISNKSRLQISITRMFIDLDGNTYEFSWIPMPVFNSRITQNNEILDTTVVKSIVPPINLSGLASVSGYFSISSHGRINIDNIRNRDVKVTLHTNRGIKSYTVNLHEHSKDI